MFHSKTLNCLWASSEKPLNEWALYRRLQENVSLEGNQTTSIYIYLNRKRINNSTKYGRQRGKKSTKRGRERATSISLFVMQTQITRHFCYIITTREIMCVFVFMWMATVVKMVTILSRVPVNECLRVSHKWDCRCVCVTVLEQCLHLANIN